MTSRRLFLAGLVSAGLTPTTTWANAGGPSFLAAAKTDDGEYVLCGLSGAGKIVFQIPLPARGHAAAAHPYRAEAVAFARRPGRFALILNCATGNVTAELTSPEGRHFYGHGSYSADGRYLFTSENEFEAAQGVIGVWDSADGYKRIGEFASGGVGPHDIKTLPTGNLVVANGGIETHPESGRAKLNIATMLPNLTYLSLTGTVLEQVALGVDLHKNSIRHLAVSADGSVAFGMQWQGDKGQVVPLVGTHKQGQDAQILDLGTRVYSQMEGYVGSIAISADGNEVAATSPRGSVVVAANLSRRELIAVTPQADVCGVVYGGAGMVVTTGMGQVIGGWLGGRESYPSLHWDNHLVGL